MKVRVLVRKGVPEVLAALAGRKPLTSAELRRVAPIDERGLALLRDEGLVEVGVKTPVRKVSAKRKIYSLLAGLVRRGLVGKRVAEVEEPVYTLTEKGKKAYEAYRLIESL